MAMSKIDRIDREIEKTRGKNHRVPKQAERAGSPAHRAGELCKYVNLVRSMCMSRDELMNFLRGGGNDAPPVGNRLSRTGGHDR